MERERHERIKEIVFRAAGCVGAQRSELLERACGGDSELRQEVEALLRFADPSDDPFRETALQRNRAEVAALLETREGGSSDAQGLRRQHGDEGTETPDRIGGYRIVGVLGQGGMGRVYLAEQEHPRRRVALKILRHALVADRLRQRFAFEASALGRLQHASIARIFEAGRADVFGAGTPARVLASDQPFIAMEFIEGQGLADFARARFLDTRQKLALAAQVCDAVHYAHQNAIIHRDLKPANILVGADGQPKVIDFGVARATDADSRLTEHGEASQFIGTLAYMSPEQIGGDPEAVDAACDVYALGVILYELLAGRPPHDLSDKSLLEASRIIREVSPAPLGTIDRRLRGDVETIVGTAMQKDRRQRYSSAAALADDIRRFMRHEPIAARPPSAWYQIRMFARRRRALVLSCLAVFLAVVAGGMVSTVMYFEASRNARIARAVNDFLNNDLLAAVSPDNNPNRDITMREVLDAASARIPGRFPDEPLVEAAARLALGATYSKLGEFDAARPHLEFAAETRRRLLRPGDEELTAALSALAELQFHVGDYPAAEATWRRIFEVNRTAHGESAFRTASARGSLAFVLLRLGRVDEALGELERACADATAASGAMEGEVLALRTNLSQAYSVLGRLDDSIAVARSTFDDARAALGPQHPLTLSCANNLAAQYNNAGRSAEAVALLEQVLESQRTVLGPEHPQTLITQNNLGFGLMKLGQSDAALEKFRYVYDARGRVLGERHPHTLTSISNLGNLLRERGALEESEPLLRRALELHTEVLGPEHPYTIQSGVDLARLHFAAKRYDDAEPILADVVARRLRVNEGDVRGIVRAHREHARCLIKLERFDDAEAALRAAEGTVTAMAEPDKLTLTEIAEAFVELYTNWGREDQRAEWAARVEQLRGS